MIRYKIYKALMLMLLVVDVGCSKNESNSRPSAFSKRRIYEESLLTLIQSFYEKPESKILSEKCDLQLKDIKLKMAKDLDDRHFEIQEYAENQLERSKNPESILEIQKIGGLTVKKRPIKTSVNEWVVDAGYSWFELIEFYNKIKETKVDAKWVQLNAQIRSTVPDEQDRIIDLRNFDILHSDEAPLRILLKGFEVCFQDEHCVLPVLQPELLNWLKSKHLYSSYWSWIDNVKDTDTKNKRMESFIKLLKRDLDINFQNKFNRLTHYFDKGSQTLTLKVVGLSEADLDLFKAYTSKPWSQMGLNINLQGVAEKVNDSFVLILEAVGGRAFVAYGQNFRMSLPNITWSTTITHEFGHILGLNDQYYTIWDEENCLFSQESNAGNIMSMSETGAILPEHIHAILEYYNQESTGL